MEGPSHVEFVLGVVAYGAATGLYFLRLVGHRATTRATPAAPWLLGAGAVLHLAYTVTLGIERGQCSLYALDAALGLVAVAMVITYLLVGRRRLQALGAFAAPMALTFLVGAEFVSHEPATPDRWSLLAIHVASNLGGLGVFLMAGAMGALFIVEERRLKSKRARLAQVRLPPLDVLDTVAHRLVLVGFPLLTVGIVSGAMFSARLVTGEPFEVARTALAFLAWCVVAAGLLLRSVAGWRGRRAAWAAVIGAGCILLVVAAYVVHPLLGGYS
ncbi:MAG: cytochrome c biogenesis protein CcsA [Polyangiaceae bacterium]|nr:cytochrome c biogenesis protein CcsA [Polyangiaceae bacterium]